MVVTQPFPLGQREREKKKQNVGLKREKEKRERRGQGSNSLTASFASVICKTQRNWTKLKRLPTCKFEKRKKQNKTDTVAPSRNTARYFWEQGSGEEREEKCSIPPGERGMKRVRGKKYFTPKERMERRRTDRNEVFLCPIELRYVCVSSNQTTSLYETQYKHLSSLQPPSSCTQ